MYVPPQAPNYPPPAPNYSGTYRGPNLLNIRVTQPVDRELPAERNEGEATVWDSGAANVRVTVRLVQGGTPCTLEALREGSAVRVVPGQRCFANLAYNGRPLSAGVQINRGAVAFNGGRVGIALEGVWAARVYFAEYGREVDVAGVALYRFGGDL